MTDSESSENKVPYSLQDDIDLLEYLNALLRAKYIIIILAIIVAIAAYFYAKTLPNRYHAFVHLALVEPQDPGGVSPDNRRAPEVFTLVEHDFILESPYENYKHRILARMRSRIFTKDFIIKYDVMQYIYAEHWDKEKQQWMGDFKPNLQEAFLIFHQNIREVSFNPENQLLGVHIRWKNPKIAAEWANAYAAHFNYYMRQNALNHIEKKSEYLQSLLIQKNNFDVEITQSIYRLIEAQTHKAMLANAMDEYALEIIDPAIPPLEPYAPSVKKFAIGAFMAIILLGSATVIAWVLLRKIHKALIQHREKNYEKLTL